MCWNDLNTDKGSKGTKVIIEICDTVLQSIVAFVQGDSLAQTVFTCLYLHDPACIQNPVLRLMCCGLLRLLEKVYTVINLAAIFEEEDINMTTYGFSLSPQISDKVSERNEYIRSNYRYRSVFNGAWMILLKLIIKSSSYQNFRKMRLFTHSD